MNKSMHVNVLLSFVVVTIMVVMPLLMLMWRGVSVNEPLVLLMDAGVRSTFLNSMLLGALVVVGSSVFALPLAFLMANTEMRRYRWLDTLFLIPFMTPPYIGSMGWILFMQPRGFMDQFVPWLSFTRERFFSLWGIVFIMSLHLFPFIYLIIRNSLREISSSLDKAGAVSGGRPFYRLLRISVPLTASAYAMGALLVFVKTISEFGTPATLGRRVKFYVLTTEIHRYTSNWPIDFGRAALISSVLLGVSMLIWYIQSLVSSKYSYATVGGKGRSNRAMSLGRLKGLAWFYIVVLFILAVVIPYFSIIATSLMRLRGFGLQVGNLTLDHYQTIFIIGSPGGVALFNSFRLGFVAATVSVLIGTFIAITTTWGRGLLARIVDLSSLLSNTIPSIVIIVGLIMFWNAPWMRSISVYNKPLMLVLAYSVLFLPFTVQYVKSNLQQMSSSLFRAGHISGGSRWYVMRRIVLPLIRPGMLSGWIMTFIISVRELVGSLMLKPPGYETTATFIYSQFEQGNVSLGMAMASVTVVGTTVVLLLLQKLQPMER